MTIKLSSIRADLDREKKGDWVDFPDWPGVRFNVSSLNLPAYEVARDLMLQRLQVEYKSDKITSDILLPKLGGLYAIHILHGWEGFDEEYTPGLAEKALTDPANRELIRAVEWCAGKISQINVQFLEKDVKNSGKPSGRA